MLEQVRNCLLGWIQGTETNVGNDLFGEAQAWCLVEEDQERKTHHSHVLLLNAFGEECLWFTVAPNDLLS